MQSVGALSRQNEEVIRNALRRNASDEALFARASPEYALAPQSLHRAYVSTPNMAGLALHEPAARAPASRNGGMYADQIFDPRAAPSPLGPFAPAAHAPEAGNEFFCPPCAVQCSGATSWAEHGKGRKHKANVARAAKGSKANAKIYEPQYAPAPVPVPVPPVPQYAAAPPGLGAPPGFASSGAGKQPGERKRRSGPAPDLRPPPALSGLGPMEAQRRSLPVFAYREKLLATIGANSVVVVEGETGSGKTTQVPQFVLEQAAAAGEACNVVVSQPRRVSAMSIAERVAQERGTPSLRLPPSRFM
jgi:hypothetical protein